MKKELEQNLFAKFPLLYADKDESISFSLMRFGFCVGDGWYNLIYDLSMKLEAEIKELKKTIKDPACKQCSCLLTEHFGSSTPNPGKCMAIKKKFGSKEKPPKNYYACPCDKFKDSYPRAVQVKEKFGGLRFYMSLTNDKISELIREAEKKSVTICEECGESGQIRNGSWIRCLCDSCCSKEALLDKNLRIEDKNE